MGLFSYICNGCNTNLREKEKVVLKHLRHGEVLGETEGQYDLYGRVYEDKHFRGNHFFLNSDDSICLSESEFSDSKHFIETAVVYKQVEVTWTTYKKLKEAENPYITLEELKTEFETLPKIPYRESASGIEAWHSICYNQATKEKKEMHLISELDPEQGFGETRKIYS